LKTKRLLMLVGSVCLALMLALPLVASCGPAAPEEGAEAELEAKLAAEKAKVSSLEDEITDLEAEIAGLRAPGEVYEWRMADEYGAAMTSWCLDPLVADISAMSGGLIDIELFSSGVLVPDDQALDALDKNIIDMARTASAYFADKMDTAMLNCLPFIWQDDVECEILLHKLGLEDIIREGYADLGAYYLSESMSGPYYMLTNTPVNSIEDLQPLKIRATATNSPWLAELGVSSTYYPAAELYTSLSTGIVDGAIYGGATDYTDLGLFEVATYIIKPTVYDPACDLYLVSLDLWNSLPLNLQTILTAAARKNSRFIYDEFQRREYVDLAAAMETYGVTVTYLPPEDQALIFQAADKQWDEQAARSERTARGIEIIRSWHEVLRGS